LPIILFANFYLQILASTYPRVDINQLDPYVPGTTVEPYLSIHHPHNEIPNIPSRELATDEWPMGNITMESLHAMFEASNMPPRIRKGFLSFLRSDHFDKNEVCSPDDYKDNIKEQGDKAVCFLLYLFLFLFFVCTI
jgi:hypothetical protein